MYEFWSNIYLLNILYTHLTYSWCIAGRCMDRKIMDKIGCYNNLPASIYCIPASCISSKNFVIVKKENTWKPQSFIDLGMALCGNLLS